MGHLHQTKAVLIKVELVEVTVEHSRLTLESDGGEEPVVEKVNSSRRGMRSAKKVSECCSLRKVRSRLAWGVMGATMAPGPY